MDYSKSSEIPDIKVPNKTANLSSVEVNLHTKYRDESRHRSIHLNCFLVDFGNLKGVVSTNARSLLLTSFDNKVTDLYKNYNNLEQIHVRSLISQAPSNPECKLFFNKGRLLNSITNCNYTLETEILENYTYPDITNLFQIEHSSYKQLNIKDIIIKDGDLLIDNKRVKEINLNQIRSLFGNEVMIVNDKSKEHSPLVLSNERNILVLMPAP